MKDISNKNKNIEVFKEGIVDGIPIALGYLAVAFSLGIAAKNAGLTPFQGLLTSALNNASAGEYAGFRLIALEVPLLEMAIVIFITNARYMLMSFAISQKLPKDISNLKKALVGFTLTDEIFGISVSRDRYLNPFYTYGAAAIALPTWSIATFLGAYAGEILPVSVVSALSVALYGMFLAIIIPEGKKNKVVGVLIILSFIASYFFSEIPIFSNFSEGMKLIILTIIISGIAAYFFPIKEDSYDS